MFPSTSDHGDPLPGVPGGGVFSGGTGPPDINDNGEVIFYASARTPASGNLSGVWSGHKGDLRLIALQGQNAPGTSAGITFRRFERTPFNNQNGDTAFLANLQGSGIDNSNDQGLWLELQGQLSLVAREGQAAPGVTDDALFETVYGDPNLNSQGQLAFRTGLTGPNVTSDNDDAIWFRDQSGLKLLAREGDPAPNAGPGVRYGSLVFDYPALNDNGVVAFTTYLVGEGVDSTNDRALWGGIPGKLQLLLRTGDVLDVDSGPGVDLRTVASIHSQISGIQGEGSLNNRQQLAFNAGFTDGTYGIFVMDISVVPEPGALSLAVLLVFAFPRRAESTGH